MPEELKWVLAAWHLALGLSVGSFLNVCIYRLPRGLSVTGRSHCPSCGSTLGFIDLIPLLSQIMLRSRCRRCLAPFSWRYFTVEAVCGLLLLSAFLFVSSLRPNDYLFLAQLVFVLPCLVAIIIIDLETYTIPDGILVMLLVVGLAYEAGLWISGSPLFLPIPGPFGIPIPQSVLGAAVGFGSLWLVGRIFSAILGEEAMGFGDIKFLGAAGALLGPGLLLLVFFFLAASLGAVLGIAAMAVRRVAGGGDSEHRVSKTRLPFGPFLAASLGIVLLFPSEIEGMIVSYFTLAGG